MSRATQVRDLPDYGFVRFRKADEAESHGWQPQTVRALQTVVGSTKQGAALALTPFATFAAQAVEADALRISATCSKFVPPALNSPSTRSNPPTPSPHASLPAPCPSARSRLRRTRPSPQP